jgi:hypothetical protein
MSRFEINPEGMAAMERQVAANVAAHLNRVVARVSVSHANRSVDDVKAELRRQAKTSDFELGDDRTLQRVAEAISRGEPAPTYRG